MKYKIGIIGAGTIIQEYLRVLTDIKNLEIVGIHSRTNIKAKKLKRKFNIKKIFSTVSEMYKEERPHGVIIGTSIESTKFFLNRKVILVTRNPLDQFAELKQYKKAISVKGFIYWYKEMQFRLMKIKNPIVLRLKFEDFVNNFNKEKFFRCSFY